MQQLPLPVHHMSSLVTMEDVNLKVIDVTVTMIVEIIVTKKGVTLVCILVCDEKDYINAARKLSACHVNIFNIFPEHVHILLELTKDASMYSSHLPIECTYFE